ncbi:hypothetical protein K2X85_05360 [bacterium]|nr:hypothetical protein [bacterium]
MKFMTNRTPGRCLLIVAVFAMTCSESSFAQAPKGAIKGDDPPPALTYHGLVPGLSKSDEVYTKLGKPTFEAAWYSWKMLYPAAGRPGLEDEVQLSDKDGIYASTEAASVPAGFEEMKLVREKLGREEYELRMPTFRLLDYTAQGVRFVFNKEGKTIGVAYVPHLNARVHGGARKLVDLSGLKEGPQPAPDAVADWKGLTCGATTVNITPKSPEWIDPRYREKYQPHDPIFARIVVFEKDGLAIALVGADLFGMSNVECTALQEKAKKLGLAHVVLASSHNHAAPDTLGVYGHYPMEYNQFLIDSIAEGASRALKNRKPVKMLRTASRELPMDGARVIGYFRNARNPGIIDPTISAIQAIGPNDKPIATIVNFACHVEGISAGVEELTADFPGYMCEQIASKQGGVAVFLNGAVGGMVSGDNKARTHDEAKVMGEGLAKIVQDLLSTAQPPTTFQFQFVHRRVELPITNLRLRDRVKDRRPTTRGRVVTEMSLLRLGEAEIITLPGEVLPEVSFEILEKMTGFPRILVGLANDQLGYIIPPYDFRDGEYEESMSVGPATAPVIQETAWRLLQEK